jgi:hypothetical protein
MTKTFKFHEDPGHGWIEVTIRELRELNIADKITRYSYWKKGVAFLEEDCDASTFIRAYMDKYREKPKFEEIVYNRDAPCRNFERYDKTRNIVKKGKAGNCRWLNE